MNRQETTRSRKTTTGNDENQTIRNFKGYGPKHLVIMMYRAVEFASFVLSLACFILIIISVFYVGIFYM